MKRILLVVIVLIVIGGAVFAIINQPSESYEVQSVNEPYDPKSGIQDRVYLLKGDTSFVDGSVAHNSTVAVVIIPQNIRADDVKAAWSYAVRNSADGFDVPNYESAIQLLMQRHPTWKAGVTKGYSINFDSSSADNDVPD